MPLNKLYLEEIISKCSCLVYRVKLSLILKFTSVIFQPARRQIKEPHTSPLNISLHSLKMYFFPVFINFFQRGKKAESLHSLTVLEPFIILLGCEMHFSWFHQHIPHKTVFLKSPIKVSSRKRLPELESKLMDGNYLIKAWEQKSIFIKWSYA